MWWEEIGLWISCQTLHLPEIARVTNLAPPKFWYNTVWPGGARRLPSAAQRSAAITRVTQNWLPVCSLVSPNNNAIAEYNGTFPAAHLLFLWEIYSFPLDFALYIEYIVTERKTNKSRVLLDLATGEPWNMNGTKKSKLGWMTLFFLIL